mgnify:CR=1 FL=1
MEPKYKVNPLTGELQEYVFEYNGILALRNFTARVEDERLILHAADDVNFSILEALVSEVEINGVVYDNPTAAQEALTRLTFNQNRPVLLDKTLKDLILNAVQKIPEKKLSTEDFTTELRTKLEGLQQVDISGLLPKGGYTGTAQDLKNLIDNINRILQSDDTDLDQLQEIVDYIKQNKHILSTLGISNIAGLVDALAAKADKDHHHDERYALITHHHNEYALRTHRHNWDDIDGKPDYNNFFEEKKGNGLKIEASKLNNFVNRPSGSYIIKYGNDDWGGLLLVFNRSGSSVSSLEFLMCHYNYGTRLSVRHGIDGNRYAGDFKDLAWWEDIVRAGVECTQNTTLQKEHQNQTLFVTVPCNIELNEIEDLSSTSFRKVFDNGEVTFTCTGKNIIYTGDKQFNGKKGSTAVISRYVNDCYIDIRNV